MFKCSVCSEVAVYANTVTYETLCRDSLCYSTLAGVTKSLGLSIGTHGDITISVAPYMGKKEVMFINDEPIYTDSFYVAPSAIPDAEFGLFANKSFKKSSKVPILEYRGLLLTERTSGLKKRLDRGYTIAFSSYTVQAQTGRNRVVGIDAYPYELGVGVERIGGFANHSNTIQNTVTKETTHLDSDDEDASDYYKMFMYAIKDINVDDEILWDYGDAYWKKNKKKANK